MELVCTTFPKTATFYLLPKIHKNDVDPPGRPIISGNGAITENLSRVVDEHLRPFVLALSSYVCDTIHLLQITDCVHVSGGSILATIDVEALYSSISHTKGLACICKILSQISHHEEPFNELITFS